MSDSPMENEFDLLGSVLDEALGLAESSLNREIAPPENLFAPPPQESSLVPAVASAAVQKPAAPDDWAHRHQQALADGEEKVAQAGQLDDNWDDAPL